ncbi:hypothetical protein HK099_004396 [Clydaea vesicula]|uniref:Uncharacterized protein n=1 Tax=Clydaea vesicula TaxID=447962 RepID=A0AAD5XY90_9FUNG|nr:hypothetical protein HK099_004396 [Clydaea vesicula]
MYKYFLYEDNKNKKKLEFTCLDLTPNSGSLNCYKEKNLCTFQQNLLNFSRPQNNTIFPTSIDIPTITTISIIHPFLPTLTHNNQPNVIDVANNENKFSVIFIIVAPWLILRVRACYKGRKASPTVTFSNPTEIAYQERLASDPCNKDILIKDLNSRRTSYLSFNHNSDEDTRSANTTAQNNYQIDVQSLNPSGSGCIRIVTPINNPPTDDTSFPHPLSPANLNILGSTSTATIYTSKPPTYDEMT